MKRKMLPDVKDVIKSEYIKSFCFGFKLLLLITALALPVILGYNCISKISNLIEKKTIFYNQALKLMLITDEDIKEKVTKTGYYVYEVTTDKFWPKVKVLTNRTIKDDWEEKRLIEETYKFIYDEYSKINPDRTKEGFDYWVIPDYKETIIYGDYTRLGNIINGINIFFFTIFSLALYFPIIKAIINIFKQRKIKNE